MITIRELTHQDDFHQVGSVYVESWRSAYLGIVPQLYLDKLTSERWSVALSADPASSLGMFLDGELIGTSHLCFSREPEREGYGEIVALYLRPEYIGKGYGRLLMEAAFRKLQADGCEAACLWALSQNTRALGFYAHMGLTPSGKTMSEKIGGVSLSLKEYCVRFTER